jgi:hypothetical protein
MRRFILFLVISLLFGCEKYELLSSPNLSGGKWILFNYEIIPISAISPVTIIKNDTICINSFGEQSFVSGGILMKQNYLTTQKDRRFIKGRTTWEFDGPSQSNFYGLFCDYTQMTGVPKPDPFSVDLSIYNKNMAIYNTTNGSNTNFTYTCNDVGYPRTMTLLSPPIITDLYMSNGTRDKAVTVRVMLYFMR